MEIAQKEIEQLEKIGQGHFGTVYKCQNKAIKLYHNRIKADGIFGKIIIDNPCLKTPMFIFFRNSILNRRLKLTKLAEERLLINGKFNGVCYDFYEGITMNNAVNLPWQTLKQISLQLIENTQELTNHHIYPLDLKLDNVIIGPDGSVYSIDLDDPHTKITLFPHPFLQKRSLTKLKNSLTMFLHHQHTNISPKTTGLLTNAITPLENKKEISYEDLYNYVLEEFQRLNLLFIRATTLDQINWEHLRNFVKKENLKIILFDYGIRSYYFYFDNFISYMNDMDIQVYDILFGEEEIQTLIKDYITGHNTIDGYKCENGFQKIKH